MSDEKPIRVMLVDDHAVVRSGLGAFLLVFDDLELVAEAGGGEEAVRLCEQVRPDVVLMDLVMPVVSGVDATRHIVVHQPGVRVLVLTSFTGVDKVFPAIKAGALGYLLKDSGPEELVRAIRQVYGGNSSLHPAIARKLLQELCDPSAQSPPEDPLTDREKEVLMLVAQGRQNQAIAERLAITEATVRTHVSHILGKLGLSSRTQAALYALRRGLASLDVTDVVA